MKKILFIVGGVTLVVVGITAFMLLRGKRTETVVVNPAEESTLLQDADTSERSMEEDVEVTSGTDGDANQAESVADSEKMEQENNDTVGAGTAEASESVTPSVSVDSSEKIVASDKDNSSDSKETEDDSGTSSSKSSVKDHLVSFGFQKSSGRKIDTVILHSTYNALGGDPYSFSKILDIYKSYGVSPHYVVERDGTVYRLVDEKNIAYHAGDSKTPDGRTNVNAFSIGIEIITKETGDAPTSKQYSAIDALLSDVKKRYAIKYVLGHSDIAPGRKSDPWGLTWSKIGGKKD